MMYIHSMLPLHYIEEERTGCIITRTLEEGYNFFHYDLSTEICNICFVSVTLNAGQRSSGTPDCIACAEEMSYSIEWHVRGN